MFTSRHSFSLLLTYFYFLYIRNEHCKANVTFQFNQSQSLDFLEDGDTDKVSFGHYVISSSCSNILLSKSFLTDGEVVFVTFIRDNSYFRRTERRVYITPTATLIKSFN